MRLCVLLAQCLLAASILSGQPQRAERERQRQDHFVRMRAYPADHIPAGARAAALAEMDGMIARERTAAPPPVSWQPIGPRPINAYVEASNGGAPFATGRVTALAVDPRNAAVVYMGAAGGGIWKTTDAGQNWKPIGDDQPSLAIGSIALAPSNPDIVYAGTGEQNNSGDSYYGAGVLKSTDGGATWTQLKGAFVGLFGVFYGGARIGALAIHPSNPDIVLAGVDRIGSNASGIYRTTDGGGTWTNVLPGAVGTEVLFDPSNPNIVYAALGSPFGNARNGVYKSTDGAATWNPSNGTGAGALPSANVGRIALAIAPSSPETLFAGIQNLASAGAGSLLGLFKSTDAGQSWTRLPAPDYCTPQCMYNNIIRVHPLNPNIVVAAGLQPYRSFDGGLTWLTLTIGSNGSLSHVDHHALAFSRDGTIVYDGNDGGVYATTNLSLVPGAWANLNSTLAITEFSSNISMHPADPNLIIAGTQDNGTLLYTGNLTWDEFVGGDGGYTAIDPAVPSIWYGDFAGISPYKLSGINSISNALADPFRFFSGNYTNGLNTTERNNFYSPLQMHPTNPMRLYFGTFRVYVSNDGAGTWKAISPDLTRNSAISTIAVSPSYPKAVCVGTADGRVQVTNTADQGSAAIWVDRSAGLPGRYITHITIDPLNVAVFYVTLSGFSGVVDRGGHIYKTTDFGETWTDISGNLPNTPVNDLVLDPDLPGVMYIATDIGVFQSTDDGNTWSTLSNGLPRVVVGALALHRPSRMLRAATYGRSMWELSVPLPGNSIAPRITSLSPATLPAGSGPVAVTVTGSNFAPAATVWLNGSARPTTFVNDTTLRVTLPAADLATSGRATLLVFISYPGSGFSNLVNLPIGPPPAFSLSGLSSAANPSVSGPLVPGSIASVFGANLASGTSIPAAPPLPFTLGDAVVEVGGTPAPLLFVSPSQINFQVPWELEGFSRSTLSIVNGTLRSPDVPVSIIPILPTVFTLNGQGSGQGAIRIAAANSPVAAPAGAVAGSRPARAGESIQIYATGLGSVSRLTPDGQTPVLPSISRTPAVRIGGVLANVTFSGLAPGTVGIYQVNAVVPAGVSKGDAVPLTVSLGGITSNSVTIAIE